MIRNKATQKHSDPVSSISAQGNPSAAQAEANSSAQLIFCESCGICESCKFMEETVCPFLL